MRALLIGLGAAAAVIPTPAAAVDPDQLGFAGNFGVKVHSGSSFGHGDFGRRDRRRHHGDDTVIYLDREYQGDTAWKSDGFNDWWHDRPDRSYPRWMISNQNCDKQWYQGDVLRC